MPILKNRAGVTTSTVGTGTITLGSAIALGAVIYSQPWQTFANAGVASGDSVRYLIFDSNGTWEYGPGTYSSTGPTLTRASGSMNGSVPGQKSSTGSLLSLSGSAQVFIAAVAEDFINAIPQHGRFELASATQVKFRPYNGDQVKINGALYTIPSGGVTAGTTGVTINGTAGQNLVAGTAYLVCLFNNAGTLTLGFYTTLSHTADTTEGNIGVEIATGNPQLTVVGMVLVNNSTQFQDGGAWRGVISWFNRRNKVLAGASTGGSSTTSTTAVEVNTGARAYFVSWSEEGLFAGVSGAILSGAVGVGTSYVALDGTAISPAGHTTLGNTSWWGNGANMVTADVADGTHYIAPFGASPGGTSNSFYLAAYGLIRG